MKFWVHFCENICFRESGKTQAEAETIKRRKHRSMESIPSDILGCFSLFFADCRITSIPPVSQQKNTFYHRCRAKSLDQYRTVRHIKAKPGYTVHILFYTQDLSLNTRHFAAPAVLIDKT